MSRSHELKLRARDRIFECVKKGFDTSVKIHKKTGLNVRYIERLLHGLEDEGKIRCIDKLAAGLRVWRDVEKLKKLAPPQFRATLEDTTESVRPSEQFIRSIPLSRLMGGRA